MKDGGVLIMIDVGRDCVLTFERIPSLALDTGMIQGIGSDLVYT